MGRKRQRKQAREQDHEQATEQPIQQIQTTANTSRLARATRGDRPARSDVETILSLPRLVRIGLVILPTFALVAIIQPIIDAIYLRYFFTMETRGVPSLITAAAALGYFLTGWLLIVGNIGETPPPRRAVQIYLYLSIGIVLLAVFWIGYLYFTNMRLQA